MSRKISQQDLETHLWGAATLLRGLVDACQRRSKNGPPWRRKKGPLRLMLQGMVPVVPVVHRRVPRCFA